MTPPNLSLFMIMVCFGIAYLLIRKSLIGPILAVLDERERRVGHAEGLFNDKTAEHGASLQRLQSEIDEAARAAARSRDELRQGALDEQQAALEVVRKEAAVKLEAELKGLESEASACRSDLRKSARDMAVELASRLLEREVVN